MTIKTAKKFALRKTRHIRIRAKVKGTLERPRLAVYKSNQYLYAQLIDDVQGRTIASAHTRGSTKTQREQAKEVGQKIAEAAKAKKISAVIFDRGGFTYAGIIKELAESARAGGLTF